MYHNEFSLSVCVCVLTVLQTEIQKRPEIVSSEYDSVTLQYTMIIQHSST